MPKYNVLVSYITEAESELQAVFNLNRTLNPLPEEELEKLEAFHVELIK
jgi:hypothetical protein